LLKSKSISRELNLIFLDICRVLFTRLFVYVLKFCIEKLVAYTERL